jgi:hypothetical protein
MITYIRYWFEQRRRTPNDGASSHLIANRIDYQRLAGCLMSYGTTLGPWPTTAGLRINHYISCNMCVLQSLRAYLDMRYYALACSQQDSRSCAKSAREDGEF